MKSEPVVTRDKLDWDVRVSNPMADVLEEFSDLRGRMGKVEFYEVMAGKFNSLVGESWTWRYIQGVEKGSIKASQKMGEAVRRMGELLDGRHAGLVGLVPVSVLAREDVMPGSVVLGKSRTCKNPGCSVVFVPDHPRRVYCSRECRAVRRSGS